MTETDEDARKPEPQIGVTIHRRTPVQKPASRLRRELMAERELGERSAAQNRILDHTISRIESEAGTYKRKETLSRLANNWIRAALERLS